MFFLPLLTTSEANTLPSSPAKKQTFIPRDPFGIAIRFLPTSERECVASANRRINAQVVEASRCGEVELMQNFIRSLIQNLGEEPQKKLLQAILDDFLQNVNYTQKFRNLSQIREQIDRLDMKTKLIEILKTLDSETINHLRGNTRPIDAMKDLFQLSIVEKEIEEANKFPPNSVFRVQALEKIAIALVKGRYPEKAMEVALMIPTDMIGEDFAEEMMTSLVQTEQSDKAILRLLELPTEESVKNDILLGFSMALILANQADKAIETILKISPDMITKDLIEEISSSIVETGQSDKAIQRLMEPPTEGKVKDMVIREISIALVRSGNAEQAILIAKNAFPQTLPKFLEELAEELNERNIEGANKILKAKQEMQDLLRKETRKQQRLVDLM